MEVTVAVAGGDTHDVVLDAPTYADCCRAVDLNPHEVAVVVDGRPVPVDQPVATDRVELVRLVKGG